MCIDSEKVQQSKKKLGGVQVYDLLRAKIKSTNKKREKQSQKYVSEKFPENDTTLNSKMQSVRVNGCFEEQVKDSVLNDNTETQNAIRKILNPSQKCPYATYEDDLTATNKFISGPVFTFAAQSPKQKKKTNQNKKRNKSKDSQELIIQEDWEKNKGKLKKSKEQINFISINLDSKRGKKKQKKSQEISEQIVKSEGECQEDEQDYVEENNYRQDQNSMRKLKKSHSFL